MINKSSELVLDKICRSCMRQNEDMRNVFESKESGGQTLQIAEMLMDCAAVVIVSGDGLPSSLCGNCENKLNLAYEFKQQCQKADSTLRELTNQPGSVIKEESCDIVVQPDFNIPGLFQDSDSDEEATKKRKSSSFTCSFCQKVLRTKKGLRIHQRRHTGDKLRSCHMCNAQFTRTHHLIRHMKIHVKDNAGHVCSECGMSFMKLPHLLAHKKKHRDEGAQSTAGGNSDCDNDDLGDGGDVEDEVDEDEDYFKLKVKGSKKGKGSFQCKYCFKVMTTFVGLKIHMRRHTGADLAKCKLCEKTFTKTSHLKRHLQTHGIREAPKPKPVEKKVMECEFCDRKFKYKKSFNHHMQTEHGMSDESDVPLSTFVSKRPKLEERDAVPETTEESPDAADKTADNLLLSDDNDIKDDIIQTPPKTNHKVHVCHVCGAAFARANHLTRHMTLHRALLTHKCDRCDKAFATPEHLGKHVEEDHVNKPYACTICNKPFSRGEHLIRHLKVHQTGTEKEDSNLTCSICEKTFSRSDHLARHIKIHLLQDKRHVCSECGKAFNRLDNLKTHQRIHTGIKDTTKLHLCIYCGKEFNNSSNMIVHMRRHTGERPYKCTQCGKGFPRSHDLKCHERTHSGEKPYHCSLCGKSFNKSNKLLRHTRVHTGERPYVCNICGRAFTQSNDLALHMRRHTGARPYACGMCPARFIQSGQLKTHRRSTGHWAETQPDLKGGHRVEPVTPIVEPAPIRFKTHGKPKRDEDQLSIEEAKTVKLLQQSVSLGLIAAPGLNLSADGLVLDPKIVTAGVELQQSGLISLGGELKYKQEDEAVAVVKVGEGTAAVEVTTAAQIYGGHHPGVYTIIAPGGAAAGYAAADYSNYQNYG